MNTKRMIVGIGVAVLAILTVSVAQATIVQINSSNTVETAFDSSISSTDLVNTGQPSLASASQNQLARSGNPANGSTADTHDGATTALSLTHGLEWLEPATTITYQFNLNQGTGGSANGYDITGINYIDGWSNGNPASTQIWDLQVATLSNPSFATIYSATNTASGSTLSTKIALTANAGYIAREVTGIQFAMTGGAVNPVLREIDVFGIASVPEPSTMLLLAVGGLLLTARRRTANTPR